MVHSSKAFDYRKKVVQLITENNYQRVAEIGCWAGRLSQMIWAVESVREIHLVDPLTTEYLSSDEPGHSFKMKMDGAGDMTQEELDQVFSKLVLRAPDHVTIHRMTSQEAAREVPDRSLDFVFIDASHFYEDVKGDIELWYPKIDSPGMIAGDDYAKWRHGLVRAVQECLPYFEHEGRVWWQRK